MSSIAKTARALAAGAKSRALVEECLARIEDPAGEGKRVFLKVHSAAARAAADYYDHLRGRGAAPSPFAGIPISIKDLFDIAGDVTTAGSTALRDAAPAKQDAPSVARLRAAGFIPIGRSNMTEFAFSGLGINPHYDTPSSPYDRKAAPRIPGGSSSGAAVSVTEGMALGGLGTDTGGSCRIPAALCGIVGFKPTAYRVPTVGAFPLSTSLDSIGPLAATVECCAILDAVLAGEPVTELPEFPLAGLRMAVPQTMVLDHVEPAVARAFDAALAALRKSGALIVDLPLRELNELQGINAKGGLSAAEAYAIHRPVIAKAEEMYDPRVLSRILRGREQDAADYIDLVAARADFVRDFGFELDENAKRFGKVFFVVFRGDKISPGLFVVARRRPSGGFKEAAQDIVRNRLVSEGARTPALADKIVYREIGRCALMHDLSFLLFSRKAHEQGCVPSS